LDLVASEILKLSQVETRQYAPGERLRGDTTERLKRLHVYIRDGAIGLWVALAGSTSALIEVFGPGRLLPPPLWDSSPGLETESRYAAALVPTTTLEVPAAAFERQVAAHPPLARALTSWNAYGCATASGGCAIPCAVWPIRFSCCSNGCPRRPARRLARGSQSARI